MAMTIIRLCKQV